MGSSVAPVKPNDPAAPHILSGDEWEQSQYAPHRAGQDPTKPMGGGRILTGDEWEQAQSSPNFGTLKFPAMPKIASDATKRLNPNAGAPDATMGGFVRNVSGSLDAAAQGNAFGPGGNLVAHGLAAVGRQAIAPTVEHPLLTAALANPVGAVVGTGMAVTTIAQYGWRKAHELTMSPEERARSEADPNRVSGEAAAVQAAMLGLGFLAGAHSVVSKAADVGEGFTDTGAAALRPLTEPNASVPHSPEGAAVREAEVAKTAATEPLTVPVVPQRAGQPEPASPVPQVGRAEEFPSVPSKGRGKEATSLTEEQRSGKVVPIVEPQTFSIGGESRVPSEEVRRQAPAHPSLFEVPKGAEILGTAAAAHGLPETASPYPPATVLDQAWAEGHASVASESALPVSPQTSAAPSEPTSAEPGAPVNRGPAALYGRLSDDALSSEYRALVERRNQEQPNAVAPLWTPEREALAVEQIENRRRPDGSFAPVDKRRLASLQLQQGEGYYEGRHTFETAAAARRVDQLNKHITAIEKEMGQRGLKPDDVLQAPAEGGGGLRPVEGTGVTKTRGLSAGVEQKAVAQGHDPLDVLPEYKSVNMADQASQATRLLSENPESAHRIATGEEQAPKGLLPESVFKAVEDKALNEGDVATIRDLASSKLTEQATTMGQRIRALAERDPESPVAAIQRIAESRNPEGADEAISGMVTELRRHLDESSASIDEDAWTKFINSIRC